MSIERKTWLEFQASGLLWFVNRLIHFWGWSIVMEIDDATGKVRDVYPSTVTFRGFGSETEDAGFVALTNHTAGRIPRLLADVTVREQGRAVPNSPATQEKLNHIVGGGFQTELRYQCPCGHEWYDTRNDVREPRDCNSHCSECRTICQPLAWSK